MKVVGGQVRVGLFGQVVAAGKSDTLKLAKGLVVKYSTYAMHAKACLLFLNLCTKENPSIRALVLVL